MVKQYIESGQKILDGMLTNWNDRPGLRTAKDAEDLIHVLQLELAGKEGLIKVLQDDLRYYRNDWNDQMIQDQGLAQAEE